MGRRYRRAKEKVDGREVRKMRGSVIGKFRGLMNA